MQLNPATSATWEKSFSTARMKTWVRLKMKQEYVCVLNLHKSRLDNLNLVRVVNKCTDVNKNLHRNFGRLSEADFKHIDQA